MTDDLLVEAMRKLDADEVGAKLQQDAVVSEGAGDLDASITNATRTSFYGATPMTTDLPSEKSKPLTRSEVSLKLLAMTREMRLMVMKEVKRRRDLRASQDADKS